MFKWLGNIKNCSLFGKVFALVKCTFLSFNNTNLYFEFTIGNLDDKKCDGITVLAKEPIINDMGV